MLLEVAQTPMAVAAVPVVPHRQQDRMVEPTEDKAVTDLTAPEAAQVEQAAEPERQGRLLKAQEAVVGTMRPWRVVPEARARNGIPLMALAAAAAAAVLPEATVGCMGVEAVLLLVQLVKDLLASSSSRTPLRAARRRSGATCWAWGSL